MDSRSVVVRARRELESGNLATARKQIAAASELAGSHELSALRVRCLLALGLWDDAFRSLTALMGQTDLPPELGRDLDISLGDLERSRGDEAKAIRSYKRVLSAEPEFATVQRRLSRALLRVSRVREAEQVLAGVTSHADSPWAWLELAELYRGQLQWEEASQAARKASQSAHLNDQAELIARDVGAAREFEGSEPRGDECEAGPALERGWPATAYCMLRSFLQHHPRMVWARILRADALEGLGRWPEAAAAYREVLGMGELRQDRRFDVLGLLGRVEFRRDRYAAAAECFMEASLLDTKSTAPRIYLGCSQRHQELYVDAESTLLDATRLEGDPDEAWLNLGFLYRSQDRLPEAMHAARRALQIDPGCEGAKKLVGDLETALEL